jgi:hypothetical protein
VILYLISWLLNELKWNKSFNYKNLNLVKDYNFSTWYVSIRGYLKKIKKLNIKICEFKTNIWHEKTSSKKLIKIKYVDQVDHYNFGINYMNFYSHLEFLNLNFKIYYKLKTHI